MPWMTFPALDALSGHGFAHRFTLRHPEIDVNAERAVVVERLWAWHRSQAEELGFEGGNLCIAEQVHGREVAVIDATPSAPVPGTDGMITNVPGLVLGIYVADCGAVFIADSRTGACGLLHSGKKGSEAGITAHALGLMQTCFGSQPEDLHVQLAPCIRPPAYEIDFAAQIRQNALDFGIPAAQVHDCALCTSSDLGRFYSYRLEKGRTGRMLALLGRKA
jgi:copper oxidase (laccase) domain-containing protein